MTADQIEKFGRLLNAYDTIREWAKTHPNSDITEFLQWQRAEAQRAYAEARRETVGEARR